MTVRPTTRHLLEFVDVDAVAVAETFPRTVVEVGFETTDPLTGVQSVTWTDISEWARSATSRRGRQHELAKFSAGDVSVVLDNADRRFDPTYTDGPYYGNLVPMRPFRISRIWENVIYRRFTGYVEAWEQDYRGNSSAPEVVLRAVDATKLLNLLRPTRTPYSDAVLADSPSIYWRLGETNGSTFQDQTTNNRDGTITGQLGLGLEGALVNDDNKAVKFTPGSYASAGTVLNFERTDSFSLEWWGKWAQFETREVWYKGGGTPASGSPVAGYNCGMSAEGNIFFRAVNTWASNKLDVRTVGPPVDDGRWHHFVITYNGTSAASGVHFYIDGLEASKHIDQDNLSASIANAGQALQLSRTSNPLSAGIDEPAIYSSVLSAARVLAHYEAGVAPWDGHRTGERINALLDLIGWPTADRDIDVGVATLGPIAQIGSILDAINDAVEAEFGAFYVDVDGKLRFDDRYSNILGSSSVITFGDDTAGTEISYETLDRLDDDTDLWTEAHVTRTGGVTQVTTDAAQVALYGRRVITKEAPWRDDNQASGVGDKLLDRYDTPKMRFTKLTCLPINDADYTAILPLRLHADRVTANRRPAGGGNTISQECWIEAITETFTDVRWEITLSLVPADAAIAAGGAFKIGTSQLNGSAVLVA